jgi:hypothetical protein
MKINVTREGREGVYIPEKESLKEFIKNSGMEEIHNFKNPNGPMVFGADHSVSSVLEDIDKAERLAVLTGGAKRHNMGHALALIENNQLEIYDIGEITENDLNIK